MKYLNTTFTTLSSLALAAGLTACDISSNDDPDSSDNNQQAAMFSLGVSDAAVEGASEVNIFISKVTLRNNDGDDTVIETLNENDEAVKINLLDFQGSDAYELIDDLELNAGDYQWIRMDLINGVDANLTQTSHVVFDDASIRPLVVKRKGNDGVGEIQLNGFELNEGNNEFIVEFDLKRSLVDPKNNAEIKLKPTGVRLENEIDSGHIEGTVKADVIGACEVDNALAAGQGGMFGHAVYLYSNEASAQTALDINESESQTMVSPVATATLVMDDDTGDYEFEMGFVGKGEYQIGYTCLSHLDDAEAIDENFSLYAYQNEVGVQAEISSEVTVSLGDIFTLESETESQIQ